MSSLTRARRDGLGRIRTKASTGPTRPPQRWRPPEPTCQASPVSCRIADGLFRSDALAGIAIKDLISQKLLGGPWRCSSAEIFMEPLEMGGIVEGHFVPTRPVASVRINDKPRGYPHLLQRGIKLDRLSIRHPIVPLACYYKTRGLEVLDAVGG